MVGCYNYLELTLTQTTSQLAAFESQQNHVTFFMQLLLQKAFFQIDNLLKILQLLRRFFLSLIIFFGTSLFIYFFA